MKKPKILDLRPCQFVLGMKEVEGKIELMSSLSKKKLQAYCDERVIPMVLGPGGEPFIIDHHHFARACWELGIKDYSVRLIEDMSNWAHTPFWNKMIKRDWTYLHDQFGLGPHDPAQLPADIRCLADDPFRSLVWAVIQEGSIEKQKVPFFEFKWSAFFRLHLGLALTSKSDFHAAIKKAARLARTEAADHLPGFVGEA